MKRTERTDGTKYQSDFLALETQFSQNFVSCHRPEHPEMMQGKTASGRGF